MLKNQLYAEVKAKLNKAKENNQPVILEDATAGMIDTKLLTIKYVGERWATGYRTVYNGGERYDVPYTINYGSLYTTANNGSHKVRLRFQEDNPFV